MGEIIQGAMDFRAKVEDYLDPNLTSESDAIKQRFYLRKIEGAEILLTRETNFFRQVLHNRFPVAPDPPPLIEESKSTRKPRPTKLQKMMAQYQVDDPDDLPELVKLRANSSRRKMLTAGTAAEAAAASFRSSGLMMPLAPATALGSPQDAAGGPSSAGSGSGSASASGHNVSLHQQRSDMQQSPGVPPATDASGFRRSSTGSYSSSFNSFGKKQERPSQQPQQSQSQSQQQQRQPLDRHSTVMSFDNSSNKQQPGGDSTRPSSVGASAAPGHARAGSDSSWPAPAPARSVLDVHNQHAEGNGRPPRGLFDAAPTATKDAALRSDGGKDAVEHRRHTSHGSESRAVDRMDVDSGAGVKRE